MKYPSIENLYASNGVDGKGRETGPEFGFKNESFGQILHWLVTEKVDGMNIRVTYIGDGPWEGEFLEPTVSISGRTDNANIPGDLVSRILKWANVENLQRALTTDRGVPSGRIVLYGEGFGPGIQKAGQAYGGEKDFILFDVKVGDSWLRWNDVVDIANKLNIPHVPVFGYEQNLEEALELVSLSDLLPAGSEHIEGIVCRTDPYLFDGWGNRVMFKYKVRDL